MQSCLNSAVMTSLIESYEKSYKNDPFFSSGVQYVTKEGVKGEEEEQEGHSDQHEEEGEEDDEEHGQGDEDYSDEVLRGENLLLLAGVPVYQNPTLVYEDPPPAYEDPTLIYKDASAVYEDSPILYEDPSLEYESATIPSENLLLAPIPEYEVWTGRVDKISNTQTESNIGVCNRKKSKIKTKTDVGREKYLNLKKA